MRRKEIGEPLVSHPSTGIFNLQHHQVTIDLEPQDHRAGLIAESVQTVLEQIGNGPP
jgi:hypothetical protein